MFSLVLVVGQVVSPAPAPAEETASHLAVLAAQSPRPARCRPDAGGDDRVTFWDAARSPKTARYCRLLARGYARLPRSPAEAHDAAAAAQALLPSDPAADVLRGRAALALGRHDEAREALARAERADPRSVAAAAALHDLAVAHVLAGDREGAGAAYRALVPRADLLGDAHRQQRAYLEAGLAVAALGTDGLDEAAAFLGEARRLSVGPGLAAPALGALALVLALQGRGREARGVAVEAQGPWSLERDVDEGPPVLIAAPGTLHALVAALAEPGEPDLARDAWQRYVEAGGVQAPWAEHAQRRIAALGKERRPR